MNYVVRPGDTLIGIATQFGVPWTEIVRVNNLQPPYSLYVGQRLFIPGVRPTPTPPIAPAPGNVERRLDRLERRVDRLETRVDDLNRRVTRLEGPRPRS
ncbi:LysM peptidoglycan-binding domain-containing protein [Brevibacillus ginsengisoli]|uniref:LysM peptidoglycan-binding domain-containing protein n=1 Tax=Brevibacillus ginsengisoli TaxID=363854 RepID=UPI003CF09983